jgi:uracil-DNA glycosylase
MQIGACCIDRLNMADRNEILRELGITPVWRRRAETPAVSPALAAQSVKVASVAATESSPASTSEQSRSDTIAALGWSELTAMIKGCTACALCKTRTQAVPGVGDPHAEWMFVGEAPGAEEDRQGEPFVGQAGRLLDNMLAAVGLQRGRNERGGVYIANVLKCRPPGNRDPAPAEVAQCTPFLERQIELVQPKLIVALGKFAAMTLLDTETSIAQLRGRIHRYRDRPLLVTYHPAYLLRSLPEKAKAWEDLCLARATIHQLQNDSAAPK